MFTLNNLTTKSGYIEITKVTDDYLLKKDKLIEFCGQNKLRTLGIVSDLARLVRFFRGELKKKRI